MSLREIIIVTGCLNWMAIFVLIIMLLVHFFGVSIVNN
jgi:hypothetical protein